jgi:PST family polysaccharide transporter
MAVYVAYNLEKVLLARFWGAEALGIYGRAYQLINIPTENLNSASSGVAFAALSRLQDDPDRFKNYFLKGYSLVLALTLPITIACALFAQEIILVFLGPKWEAAIPVFQLLTPTIVVFALINPMWWLLSSVGLLMRSLKIALVIAPLVISAYVLGLPYGPKGVALAYSCAMTLWLVPHILWCIHGTVISIRDILSATGQPFLSAIAATSFAFIFQHFYAGEAPPLVRLLIGGGIVFCSYLWMLLYVMGQKSFYLDLLQSIRKRATGEEVPSSC